MSASDIYKGDRWANEIGSSLDIHQLGIICVTPENVTAPWILFEAGAISKQLDDSKVFPLLLGMSPADLEGPMSQFQSTVIEKSDFKKLIQAINLLISNGGVSPEVLDATFNSFWPKMEKELQAISEVKIEGTALNISNVTSAFGKYGLPEPNIGNHVYFSSGFESHNVYSSAYDLAQKRIWIWGRKNRKVFDKEHKEFFASLGDKIEKGFDFRVMFLDPNSKTDIISKAHKDNDFPSQLKSGIKTANEVCENSNIDILRVAKMYDGLRNTGMVIVDDAVLYSPIQYDKDGCVEPMTKAPFSILGTESRLGADLEKSFLSCWNTSKSMTQ